jgi:signal transduction histidine kinase
MTVDALERLATPFPSTRRDGTGLGLKIARRIVGTHGGHLEINSVPGAGTSVVVTLPKRSHDRADSQPVLAEASELATTGPPGRDRV